ncbi:hypothetical protein [Hymenobacter armeniacus]|uniref:Uncharacterized protein n=1 Tax=Hymenobacter armeniacus TaxID=2771358 RepID=A0ABR8JUT9_9BACT|nr:hypothetical protein [Hymenobacter armeniacus]MBD2723102.1 hypothetical protein [Hymenobacter armeniacus]
MEKHDKDQLDQLLQKYLDGRATPEEHQRVQQWYDGLVGAGAVAVETTQQLAQTKAAMWARIKAGRPAEKAPDRQAVFENRKLANGLATAGGPAAMPPTAALPVVEGDVSTGPTVA